MAIVIQRGFSLNTPMEQLTLFDKQLIRTEPTRAEIAAARFTRAQLAAWGVPWPPPKGWRAALEAAADARDAAIRTDNVSLDPGQRRPVESDFRQRFPHLYRRA